MLDNVDDLVAVNFFKNYKYGKYYQLEVEITLHSYELVISLDGYRKAISGLE